MLETSWHRRQAARQTPAKPGFTVQFSVSEAFWPKTRFCSGMVLAPFSVQVVYAGSFADLSSSENQPRVCTVGWSWMETYVVEVRVCAADPRQLAVHMSTFPETQAPATAQRAINQIPRTSACMESCICIYSLNPVVYPALLWLLWPRAAQHLIPPMLIPA